MSSTSAVTSIKEPDRNSPSAGRWWVAGQRSQPHSQWPRWGGHCVVHLTHRYPIRGWRSTVRCGEPSDLGVTTMLWSHVTGVLGGTFWMTPRASWWVGVGSVRWGNHMQPQGAWGPQFTILQQHTLFMGKTGGWPSTVPWPCGWGRICPLRVIRTPLLMLPGGCPICVSPWGRTEPLCQRCTQSKYVVPMVQVCRCAHKRLRQLSHGGKVWAVAVILWRASRGFHRISCCRWLGAYLSAHWCWCRQSRRKHLLGSLQPHCLTLGPWCPIWLGALALWPWSSSYTICTLLVC